jgi:hypothetical protein
LLQVLAGAIHGNRFAPVAMGVGMMASFAATGTVRGALSPALGIDADMMRTTGSAMLIDFVSVMFPVNAGQGPPRDAALEGERQHRFIALLVQWPQRGKLALGGGKIVGDAVDSPTVPRPRPVSHIEFLLQSKKPPHQLLLFHLCTSKLTCSMGRLPAPIYRSTCQKSIVRTTGTFGSIHGRVIQ